MPPTVVPPIAPTTRILFVTGGVLSSLGKGIAAASIGRLLVERGLRVTVLKLDPYLNVDPGTMAPTQHGEVFVTEDGAETDLDLGHYERFCDVRMGRANSVSAGRIYTTVLANERQGAYLGATVQMIPHVTDEIKMAVARLAAPDVDVIIVELGGTVGDIESLVFVEAIRQIRQDLGRERTCVVHTTLVPYIASAGEVKTKPAQHSVRQLMELGVVPDFLLCRTERPLPEDVRRKIAAFCNVPLAGVIDARDVESIYEVPLMFAAQQLDTLICAQLQLPGAPPALTAWREMVRRTRTPARGVVRIAAVGKYLSVGDAYKSVTEALRHGGIAHDVGVTIDWIDAEALERGAIAPAALAAYDGVLVPGGFGIRGVEGKMLAAQAAREQGVPYLGLCLGLQVAVIEFARHVAGLTSAHSTEFVPDAAHPVVALMDDQRDITAKGGTMRLGRYDAQLTPGSRVATLFGAPTASDRHRHRYEVNPAYHAALTAAGLSLSGRSADGRLVELIELPAHPWFIATQAHPELSSRPLAPHPLFAGFVGAAVARRDAR